MIHNVSVLLFAAAAAAATASVAVKERNFTLRGEGWFDSGNARFGQIPMREARFTLRDNGDFAVTLFVRNERYLIRGRWETRGNGNVERIVITDAFGQRASGNGTLIYDRGDNDPHRMVLNGRTGDGDFRAELSSGRGDDWEGRDRPNASRDLMLGSGNRLYRDVEAETDGTGLLRMSGIRDGRLNTVRARMGTNRDARLEFGGPTRGVVRGQVINVRDNRVVIRVEEILGAAGTGEMVVTMENRERVDRIEGSGSGRNGSWHLEFDGRSRDRIPGNDGWGRGFEFNERGSGWLRQDVGPTMNFDRMRVTLDPGRDALIRLEGRREPMVLRGRWRDDGNVIRVDLSAINEMRARGRVELERDGRRVLSMHGNGQTDRGRFEVRFRR
jgi:hypothetical protein